MLAGLIRNVVVLFLLTWTFLVLLFGESILALHSLIPDFQAKNKLQKVNVIFLTDGEGYQNSVTVARKGRYPDSPDYVGNTKHHRTAIRDRDWSCSILPWIMITSLVMPKFSCKRLKR